MYLIFSLDILISYNITLLTIKKIICFNIIKFMDEKIFTTFLDENAGIVTFIFKK